MAEQEFAELTLRVVAQADAVADVGAIEAGDELPRVLQRKPLDDFLARALVRRGGERDARHLRKTLVQDRQLAVLRPEIVAPLRHAVRLVDREQRDLGAFELIEEARGQQPFRRHVKQVQLAGQQPSLDLALRIGSEAGIEICRRHARFAQGIDLVLHQRDQRRHHDRRALAQQRGNLVTQRLAAAGRHQYECIAAFAQVIDDGLLLAAETGVAENALQQLQG